MSHNNHTMRNPIGTFGHEPNQDKKTLTQVLKLILLMAISRFGVIGILWIGLVMLPVVDAANYHVSPLGSDSNVGTSVQPWRTVQRAVDQAQAGDTIFIEAGEYDEVVTTKNAAAGTAANGIVIDGQGISKVFRFEHYQPYYTFKNLKFGRIVTNPETRSLFRLEDGAHQTIVSNCFFDGRNTVYSSALSMSTGNSTFDPNAPSFCTVVSNVFTGTKGQAVLYVGGTSNLIANNTVTNVVQCDFLRLWGEYNVIRANVFSNNVSAPPEEEIGFHIDFVQTFGINGFGSRYHVIERNLIVDMDGQIGQLVEGTEGAPALIGAGAFGNWIFRNNIFARINLGCSQSIPTNYWYNNIFYRTGGTIGSGNPDRGSTHGVQVFNNVFLECGQDPTRDNTGWYSVNTDFNDTAYDYNYVAGVNYAPKREECPFGTPFRWCEDNGINGGDPRFVDPENLDFRLMSDSPLIGAGIRVPNVPDDYSGNMRPQTGSWSIGAFQSLGAASPPGPPSNLRADN